MHVFSFLLFCRTVASDRSACTHCRVSANLSQAGERELLHVGVGGGTRIDPDADGRQGDEKMLRHLRIFCLARATAPAPWYMHARAVILCLHGRGPGSITWQAVVDIFPNFAMTYSQPAIGLCKSRAKFLNLTQSMTTLKEWGK